MVNRDGKWWGDAANDPRIKYYPHCPNQCGICGTTSGSNHNTPLNTFGDHMPANIQTKYQKVQEIVLSTAITAHNKGYAGEVPTQDCFDAFRTSFIISPKIKTLTILRVHKFQPMELIIVTRSSS